VSFGLGRGEVLCLIGPNGSGKTTLFNIVSGLLPPTSGKIRFKHAEIQGLASHRIAAAGIGRTFQNARLFPNLTILENLVLPQYVRSGTGVLDVLMTRAGERRERKAVGARAESLLGELAGGRLFSRRFDYPTSCSLGEQRMIEIMRVLALDPELVLMDEPTQGLNPVWIAEMLRLIEDVRGRGKTILLVEHKMSVVMRVSERIVVLNSGRKICEGPPDIVRNDPQVLHAYLGQ
jgi:branched-chain amino acid transport system ATP-binding protein